MKKLYLIALLLCTLLTGCDKLDDNDDGAMGEVLPGTWAFSYELTNKELLDVEFNYEQAIFHADNTCELTYIDTYKPLVDDNGQEVLDDDGNPVYVPVYDALRGSWQANNTLIRIVSKAIDGKEHILLWRILSFTQKVIKAEYEFDNNNKHITATVTLERI